MKPKDIKIKFVLLILVFAGMMQIAGATNYYIDGVLGNDANDGLTIITPFKTIQMCLSNGKIGADDICYVRAGVYLEAPRWNRSGTLGHPMTFAAYPGEENQSVINGTGKNVYSYSNATLLISANYTNMSNIRLENSNGTLLQVTGNTTNNSFYNNWIRNASLYCAFVAGNVNGYFNKNITFNGNTMGLCSNGQFAEGFTIRGTSGFEIANTVLQNSGTGRPGGHLGGEGIAISNSENGTVHHNTVNNTKYVGIYINGGIADNIDVFDNIIHDVREGVSFSVAAELNNERASNIDLYNNIIYNPSSYCFAFGAQNVQHNISYVNFVGNTCNGTQGIWMPAVLNGSIVIRNNVESEITDTNGSTIIDHNWNYSIDGLPGFVEWSNASHNYHLNATSPLIDRGISSSIYNLDFDGITRPQGAAYDIGAYEYVAISASVSNSMKDALYGTIATTYGLIILIIIGWIAGQAFLIFSAVLNKTPYDLKASAIISLLIVIIFIALSIALAIINAVDKLG